MIKYLKEKIADFIIGKRLRNNTTPNQSFSNLLQKTFTFLVIMPEEEDDFQKSMEVLRFLDDHGKNLTIFSYNFRRNLINQKYRPATIEYGLIDRTRLGLPSGKIINELENKEFNAVIDLNRDENVFCSFAANLVTAPVRIGFRKKNADKFYNVQISDNEDNSEISYKNFLNCLQMF